MKRFNLSVIMVLFVMLTLTACSAEKDSVKDQSTVVANKEPSTAVVTEPAGLDSNAQETTPTQVPTAEEKNVKYVSQYLDKAKSYNNITDLNKDSKLVFIGECVSAEPVFQNLTLYTLSKIKVDKVIKGDISKGDIIPIVEVGGRVTNGEYSKGCEIPEKDFEKDATKLPDDQQLVVGVDGFYTFRQGEKVLIYAQDVSGFLENFNEPLYGITGGYDGKLFKQEDGTFKRPLAGKTDKHDFGKNSLVITMDELNQ